jgi:hypothetical protein
MHNNINKNIQIIYMKFFQTIILALVSLTSATNRTCNTPSNNCIQFSVSSGTGCAWMCNYCANQLGTNNYYFPDGVCSYQQGQGCVGNPIIGKTYSCCAV